jgi:membrane protease YdiL (CAAX protease family)
MTNEVVGKNNITNTPENSSLESGRLGVTPRARLFEVCVFVLLILPSLILSFFATSPTPVKSFAGGVVSIIMQDIGLLGLVVVLVWRDGESVHDLGWNIKNHRRDLALGVFLWVAALFLMTAIQNVLDALSVSGAPHTLPSSLTPKSTIDFYLAGILVFVVAVAEETVFRGYLLLRFKQVTKSTLTALILSSTIFATGHGYEGIASVFIIGMFGFGLGLVYLWRKSLVAPVVIHFMQDFLGLVIIPFMNTRSAG